MHVKKKHMTKSSFIESCFLFLVGSFGSTELSTKIHTWYSLSDHSLFQFSIDVDPPFLHDFWLSRPARHKLFPSKLQFVITIFLLSRPARHKLFPSKLQSCCRWDHKRWQPLIRNLGFDQMLATSSFLQNQIALEMGSYRMTTFDSTTCK